MLNKDKMIVGKDIVFEYGRYDMDNQPIEGKKALDNLSLSVDKKAFIGIVGHNGSGKSTLARHLNGLLVPTKGSLWVDGMDTKDQEKLWQIRQSAGMVFQNPDNQIIGTIVEEDVGFGPENIGIETNQIWTRVKEALKTVGMEAFSGHSPDHLSGGQKQRVAIAGVLAMKPSCIILDEATAMLDPRGRKEVIEAVKKINKEDGVTVILITHFMDEVIHADHVYVMDKGKIYMEGTPREVFGRSQELLDCGLELPEATRLALLLRERGVPIREDILEEKELIEEIERICN